VDEVERSLEDATSVVAVAIEDGKVITGGGSSATEIALTLRDFAATVGGREQIAIEAFADAMEVIPRTLSENAGLDPIDILIELRKEHKKGNKHAGVNVFTGKVTDMKKENVLEPIRVGTQAVSSATDAAVMVLRIDDVIAARSGGGAGGAGGPKGGEGGEGGRVVHSEMELFHPVEPEAVTATYRNGVLDVTLPRRRGHRVRIKRGD